MLANARQRQREFDNNRFSGTVRGTGYNALIGRAINIFQDLSEDSRRRLEAQSIRAQAEYDLSVATADQYEAQKDLENARTSEEAADAGRRMEDANERSKQASRNIGAAEQMEIDATPWDTTTSTSGSNGCGAPSAPAPKPEASQYPTLDGISFSSCETMRASWQRFMDQCDRTDAWDRPGTECNELARRLHGCVSTTVIYPDPEGGTTCSTHEGASDTELSLFACRQRAKVSSTLAIHFDHECSVKAARHLPNTIMDICSDPAALVSADACLPAAFPPIGNTTVSPTGAPQPLPRGAGELIDGLRLSGREP